MKSISQTLALELLAFVKDYADQADCGDGGEHEEDKTRGRCWHCTASRLVRMVGLDQPQIIRVFIESGLVNEITGIPMGSVVRIIDMDTEGSDESDGAHPLRADDIPPKNDDIGIVQAFVTDHLPDGSKERPYAS